MTTPTPRFWELFYAVYEALPRQGPGNRACAARALALCPELPPEPRVLDLGCGVGGQTLHLAELTGGHIVALDRHAPSVQRLRTTAAAQGLAARIEPVVGDMADPGQPPESFDLIWSEGALYNLGIERALGVCFPLLRPGGYLAFTEAVWLEDDPPADLKASFDFDYPQMGDVENLLEIVAKSPFTLIGHFTLPDEAWWDDFYTPMQARIQELQAEHAGDAEAEAILAQLAEEPEMHRRAADWYAYEMVVLRRP